MLSCRLRYVAVSWPWCVPLCTCCSWISWHIVAQHVLDTGSLALGCPTYFLVLYDLALGCPTLRSGTWLPNAHGCLPCVLVYSAVHIIWSPSPSFIPTVILCDIYYHPVVLCDVLWTFSTSSTWYSWTVYICLHEHCYYMDISLLAHLFIPPSPRSMFIPWRYSIITQVLVDDLLCFQSFLVVSSHSSLVGSLDITLCCNLSHEYSVHTRHSSTVLFMHSCDSVCLTWNVITMSCRPCIILSMISVTYCFDDDTLLYCRSVGAAFLISMDVVLLICCWFY